MENSDKKQELEETLIQAGLRKGYFTLAEGVYDPGILKAVFLAGGPGSGKSAVASTLFDAGSAVKSMSASGLKMVNSDTAFELLLKKGGYGLDIASMPDDLYKFVTSDDPNSVRSKAKQIMQRQFDNYKDGRIGVIVDGTGDDHKKIKKQKKELEALGYDCYMVYVNTTLDVAQERNAFRARKLKPELVKAIWTDVQSNAGAFQGLFGGNMTIVDNTKDSRDPEKEGKLILAKPVMKAAAKFIARPIKNPIGKKWVKLKMGSDKASKSGDTLNRRNEGIEEAEGDAESVKLPMDLERYLSRTMFIIGKFNLDPRKNLAILSRFVSSMELDQNAFIRYFNKIRNTNFGPSQTKAVGSKVTEIISELMTEGLGEQWYLELAKKGSPHSYASRKNGNQRWATKLAETLIAKKDDYEFIGIYTEGETDSGPILEGVVYHCTEFYMKKSPYMYFEKKDACKSHLRNGKPQEYIEG